MVMNNLPALPGFSKNQREPAMRFVVGALQMPLPKGDGGVLTNRRNLEIRERQCAHLGAGVVALLVSLEHCLPTARDVIPRNKDCVGRTFVAIHVAFYVAAVPGIALRIQDGGHGRGSLCVRLVSFCCWLVLGNGSEADCHTAADY